MSLRHFARTIRRLSRDIEDNTNELTKNVGKAVIESLVPATPVRHGFARANWQTSLDGFPESVLATRDPSGQKTIESSHAVIASLQVGESIYIANNIPYITLLNAGSSRQAPAGFVLKAVQRGLVVAQAGRIIRGN